MTSATLFSLNLINLSYALLPWGRSFLACRVFGVADCHSQCAHWSRNDTLQEMLWLSDGGVKTPRPYAQQEAVRPGPITQHLVGQGPCALPEVRHKVGGRGRTPPYGGKRETGETGRRGRRPLRTI